MAVNKPTRERSQILFLSLVVAALAFLALQPSTELLLQNNSSFMVTDGGDSLTSTFQSRILVDTWRNHPARLFSPAVHTEKLDAPDGRDLAFSWLERWALLAGAGVFSVEQAANFLVHLYFALNFVSCLWLLRYRKTSWPVAIALAACFTITPFFRARATVHPALTGVFGIPLAVLALLLIREESGRRRGLALPAALLFFAGLSAQYHVLALLLLSPMLAFFLLRASPVPLREKLTRAALASLPLLLLLAATKAGMPHAKPLFTGPETVAEKQREYAGLFSASPVDYLTGDLIAGTADWNPLRHALSASVRPAAERTIHERVNGIRWTILLLALAALAAWLRDPRPHGDTTWFAALFFFAIWCSFGESAFSPAWLFQKAVPEFRVWNRIGQVAHLFLLLASAPFAERLWGRVRHLSWAWVLPALLVLDFVPLAGLPVMRLPPDPGAPASGCGNVIAWPYVSETKLIDAFNVVQAGLRRSDCALVNRSGYDDFPESFTRSLGAAQLACLGVKHLFFWRGKTEPGVPIAACEGPFCAAAPSGAPAKDSAKLCVP